MSVTTGETQDGMTEPAASAPLAPAEERRAPRRARPDPAPQVRRPPRNKRRELLWTAVIAVVWFALAKLALGGEPITSASDGSALPWLGALTAGCWLAAEWVGRRHMMLWPASALGIVGPLTLGIIASMATPEMRAMSALERLPVIYGTTSAGMLIFLLRFRLPGLVSPVALFATVALFLWLTGGNAEALAKVEGLTPRGVLAALLDRPEIAAVFGTLSFGACWLGWHLDRNADFFGVEAARPLHIVGGGILALILGRFAGFLPAYIDLAVLLALYGALVAWSLRIDRMAVLSAGTVAMTRPLTLAVIEPLGIRLTFFEWGAVYVAMLGVAMVLFLMGRRAAQPAGWTRKPRNIRWEWSDPVVGWREYKKRQEEEEARRRAEAPGPVRPDHGTRPDPALPAEERTLHDRADAERDRLGA